MKTLGRLGSACQDSEVLSLRRHATIATDHQRLEVWKSGSSCEFRVAGAVHAWWHRDRHLTGLAWDNLAAACLLRPAGPPASVLMLGLAGGTALRILRKLLPDARFAAVDIDREVVEVAREHMHLDQIGIEVHFGDAYEWVATHRKGYDIVIDDCYLAGDRDVFRPGKSPGHAIATLTQCLNPGGLFLTNLVTGAGHRRVQSRTRAAFKRHFPEVRSVTTCDSDNETLVGGDKVLAGGALSSWETCWTRRKDLELWRRIQVRGLKIGHPS